MRIRNICRCVTVCICNKKKTGTFRIKRYSLDNIDKKNRMAGLISSGDEEDEPVMQTINKDSRTILIHADKLIKKPRNQQLLFKIDQ